MIISNAQILDFMKDGANFLFYKDGKEGELCCEVNFSDVDGVFMGAYQAFLEGEVFFETEDYGEMLAFLEANAFEIESMNGFESLEDFQKDREFQQIDMQGLLERYADCDTFSLCAFYGEHYLSKEEGTAACMEMARENRAYLEKLYLRFQDEGLPPFDVLYEEITAECKEYMEKRKKRGRGDMPCFICDDVGRKTKYSEPMDFFWHFYHMLGMDYDNLREVERLACLPKRLPTDVLNEAEYLPLKPHLLRYRISFKTHCTICGSMQKELFFALNDETKAWLSQRKNDYDFNGALQDLAFYKNGNLRFSSCTHEGYHDDIE